MVQRMDHRVTVHICWALARHYSIACAAQMHAWGSCPMRGHQTKPHVPLTLLPDLPRPVACALFLNLAVNAYMQPRHFWRWEPPVQDTPHAAHIAHRTGCQSSVLSGHACTEAPVLQSKTIAALRYPQQAYPMAWHSLPYRSFS